MASEQMRDVRGCSDKAVVEVMRSARISTDPVSIP